MTLVASEEHKRQLRHIFFSSFSLYEKRQISLIHNYMTMIHNYVMNMYKRSNVKHVSVSPENIVQAIVLITVDVLMLI